ncbi:MAG: NnrS family protein [Candidatus Nitricoxidivorans perseverans]|uniref:NnrS family protein n=1 Tax=Candidatus Nitricoxidivorans perseverans TaxID=2975601 RepID=A0AA49FL88_9PROT|nr:MAG: NnrS family protein [Candidatus Nitricoxidivorans perseverans]
MNLSSHPFWQAGFRPFFALACLSGVGLSVLWALIFTGAVSPPQTSFSVFQWHAHEMFFGFGWAVLGGFLLTSTKNWVGIRGYHGKALVFLAAAWVFERAGMWLEGAWPPLLFRLSNNLFLVSIVAMILWTLLRYRAKDSYRGDNIFFLLLLPLFPVAKNLMLGADAPQAGWVMAIGLFRLAFLIMLERTLSQFMKGAFQVDILRNGALDKAIKALALVLAFAGLLPPPVSAALAVLLALLLAGRFAFWKPHLALRRLDIGVMYLGYLAIVAQLLLDAAGQLAHPAWIGTVSVHVFTFGAMGLVFPAMLIRISKGHTGRKPAFDGVDKAALRIMVLAFILRVIAPQALPGSYPLWISLAAACWLACFAMLGWRYIPFLMQPRVDGKAG